jgi:hypothetical protein
MDSWPPRHRKYIFFICSLVRFLIQQKLRFIAYSGSRFRIFLPSRIPGSKKARDPGSATLVLEDTACPFLIRSGFGYPGT